MSIADARLAAQLGHLYAIEADALRKVTIFHEPTADDRSEAARLENIGADLICRALDAGLDEDAFSLPGGMSGWGLE